MFFMQLNGILFTAAPAETIVTGNDVPLLSFAEVDFLVFSVFVGTTFNTIFAQYLQEEVGFSFCFREIVLFWLPFLLS